MSNTKPAATVVQNTQSPSPLNGSYPELEHVVNSIYNEVLGSINRKMFGTKTEHLHGNQWVLEELIKKLNEAV